MPLWRWSDDYLGLLDGLNPNPQRLFQLKKSATDAEKIITWPDGHWIGRRRKKAFVIGQDNGWWTAHCRSNVFFTWKVRWVKQVDPKMNYAPYIISISVTKLHIFVKQPRASLSLLTLVKREQETVESIVTGSNWRRQVFPYHSRTVVEPPYYNTLYGKKQSPKSQKI